MVELEKGGKRRKGPLKVVVMSATADVEGLVQFFDKGLNPPQEVRSIPAGDKPTEATRSTENLKHKGQKKDARTLQGGGRIFHGLRQNRVSTCFVEGRQFPVKTIYLSEPTQDWVEAALRRIFQIHYKEPLPGDILVFLTGQDMIENLEKLLGDYAQGMDTDVPKVRCVKECGPTIYSELVGIRRDSYGLTVTRSSDLQLSSHL